MEPSTSKPSERPSVDLAELLSYVLLRNGGKIELEEEFIRDANIGGLWIAIERVNDRLVIRLTDEEEVNETEV